MKKKLCSLLLGTVIYGSSTACGNDPGYRHPDAMVESADEERPDGRKIGDASPDTEKKSLITDEQEGVHVLAEELAARGYLAEINDGSWRVTLQNPKTEEYSVVLQPDVRFRRAKKDTYSYLEFLSLEEVGTGIVSEVPFYREFGPDTEENLRRHVQDL